MFLTLNLALQVSPTAPVIQYAFVWLAMSVVTIFLVERLFDNPISVLDYLLTLLLWPLLLFIFCIVTTFEAIEHFRNWYCKIKYGKRFSWQFWRD